MYISFGRVKKCIIIIRIIFFFDGETLSSNSFSSFDIANPP
jgi:hypothetical protein